MTKKPISADSHVTEPASCYYDHIDPKYRDIAPRIEHDDKRGDVYVVEGFEKPIPMGLVAAAGKDPRELRFHGSKYEDLHPGGWDGKARLAEQDRDGVAAEIIYPTVGMVICAHQDFDYKKACFDAYNRWIMEYCAPAPDRLFAMAQLAMRSPEEGIEELRRAKEAGFRGVMMPGEPQFEDYDHPAYDPFYEAAVDLDLPLSFHILTSDSNQLDGHRGPAINAFHSVFRGNQDIIGMFIFGHVFERHPKLKLVCIEADAGWVPHYMYRMDHMYNRHRYWMKCEEMSRLPSEYFRENVYLTFQDDWTAFQFHEHMNTDRLMWANDFPHSDATWPNSQELLAEHAKDVPEATRARILRENVAELYGLEVA